MKGTGIIMNERRKILDQFEDQKIFLDETVPANIEANRKGFAQIRVTDGEGNPIPDARVHAAQKTHAFKYGANLFIFEVTLYSFEFLKQHA